MTPTFVPDHLGSRLCVSMADSPIRAMALGAGYTGKSHSPGKRAWEHSIIASAQADRYDPHRSARINVYGVRRAIRLMCLGSAELGLRPVAS